ncbi:MAG: hypothetical protein IJ794_09680 [Lachnospiraceae bacterium]|nr:hypothetical protein [Lachnospiraceae bacterium]
MMKQRGKVSARLVYQEDMGQRTRRKGTVDVSRGTRRKETVDVGRGRGGRKQQT